MQIGQKNSLLEGNDIALKEEKAIYAQEDLLMNSLIKILVIDDSLFLRTQLTHILTDAKYKVVGGAGSWDSGLKMIAEKNPDIITLDIILPTASGIDILKIIKKEFPHIKVIMISALDNESIIQEAIEEGAVDFIKKPFDEKQVLSIIRKHH